MAPCHISCSASAIIVFPELLAPFNTMQVPATTAACHAAGKPTAWRRFPVATDGHTAAPAFIALRVPTSSRHDVLMASDVIVIGSGVAGASAAYRLARDGVSVTLVDARHKGQATAAGAGIVSYAGLRHTSDEWRRFFQAATTYHRGLVEDLAGRGEAEIGYRVVGELIVAPARTARPG